MDILFVRDLFRPADFGGNRYPWEVTRRLAERGNTVRVVTPRPAGPLPAQTGAELHHYPVSRRTPFETFFTNALFSQIAVRREIARRRPDVIVLSSYDVAYGHFLTDAGRPRIPAVYIYHSSFYSDAVDRVARKPWPLRLAHGPLDRFTRSVERVTFRSADAIVAVSPFSRREIEARVGTEHRRIVLIPTGVDTDFFRPGDRRAARARLGLPGEARVLLTVGRLAPVKRYDRAIDATALLHREDPRHLLLIVGRGPAEMDLRERARAVGAGVRLVGFVDGEVLRDHYLAADLVLCTSEFENWSLSILESLACGTPVLGTPRGSIPDLLRPVRDDLVVADTTPATVAAGVRSVLGSTQRLLELSERARTAALRYSWDATVNGLEKCFSRVIERSL